MRKRSGMLAVACALALAGSASAAEFAPIGSVDLGRPGADPAAVGSWSFDGTTHSVNAGGSDWWDGGEYAHFAYKPVSGDFFIQTEMAWVNRTGDWNAMDFWIKGGLAVRNDIDFGAGNEREVNYTSAYLRPDRNAAVFQGRPSATANMFNMETGGVPAQPVKLALNRWTDAEGDVLVQGLVDKGSGWQVIGSAWAPNLNNNAYVGFFATAHQNDGRLETAQFTNATLTGALAPGALPRKLGGQVMTPETLTPVVGGWSVLEVINNGDMNNVADAVRSLESSGGTRHMYTLMGALNINDHEGNAKNFGGDRGYGVRNSGIVSEVNHLALLARGQILIPESGEYTFYINSDDGEELSIGNRKLVIGSEGWNDNNFGTVYLEAGVHPIQVIHREATGGANIEVAAAKGRTTNLVEFNLIGSNAPARDAYNVYVPGFAGDVHVETTRTGLSPNAGSRDAAIQAILNGRNDGTNVTATADRINHEDPQNSGTWAAAPRLPFPNNTDADDNDFAFFASGSLVVPATGTYYIGFDSDDGASLQVVGQIWKSIVRNETGNAVIEGDWLKTDAWTGHSYTVGAIDLVAGVNYELNFYSYEGGGGAHASVFGSSQQGNYFILLSGSGQTINVPSAAAAIQLVPEPGTLSLLAIGALGLMARRRGR